MHTYWIAIGLNKNGGMHGSLNSGKKNTSAEAASWGRDQLDKIVPGLHSVAVAKVYSVIERTSPPITERDLIDPPTTPPKPALAVQEQIPIPVPLTHVEGEHLFTSDRQYARAEHNEAQQDRPKHWDNPIT